MGEGAGEGKKPSKGSSSVFVKNRVFKDSSTGLKDKFVIGDVLGEGTFGVVTLVEDKATGTKYACKSLNKAGLTKEDMSWYRKEAAILKEANHPEPHPHIVKFLGCYEDADQVHFILELCSGGELFDRIVDKGSFSEHDAAIAMKTMIGAVAYLHQKQIVHRDLKPENFLLGSPADDAALKLTDFGCSDFCEPGGHLREMVGSTSYMAPEVFLGKYDERADVWSLGVILYTLLSGRPPFDGRTEKELFQMARRGKFDMIEEPWPRISDEAKELIRKMLTVNPAKRPSADELLQHPWIADETIAKKDDISDIVCSGLMRFSAMNRLKKRAIQVMTKSLQEEDVAHLREMFQKIDLDRNGTVAPHELKEAIARHGSEISDQELENIIKSYDVDGNGVIDMSEFISALTDVGKLNTVDNIRRAFAEFDRDADGSISAEEVLLALQDVAHMDMEKAREVLKEADVNGDGVIDWNEFYDMMVKRDDNMYKALTKKRTRTILLNSPFPFSDDIYSSAEQII